MSSLSRLPANIVFPNQRRSLTMALIGNRNSCHPALQILKFCHVLLHLDISCFPMFWIGICFDSPAFYANSVFLLRERESRNVVRMVNISQYCSRSLFCINHILQTFLFLPFYFKERYVHDVQLQVVFL